jgi:hypothetical protein
MSKVPMLDELTELEIRVHGVTIEPDVLTSIEQLSRELFSYDGTQRQLELPLPPTD